MAIRKENQLIEELCQGLIPHVYVDGSYINPKQIVDIDTTEYKGKEVPEFTLADGTVVAHNRFEAGDIGHFLDSALTKLRGPVGEGADFKPPTNRVIGDGRVYNHEGEVITYLEQEYAYHDNHIDVGSGKMFGGKVYTNSDGDAGLWSFDMNGGNSNRLVTVTQLTSLDLIESIDYVVYAWVDSNDDAYINAVAYDGSTDYNIVGPLSGGYYAYGMIAENDKWIFYSNSIEEIYRANQDGSSNTKIADLSQELNGAQYTTIDEEREEIYFFSDNGEYHGRVLDYDGNILRTMGVENGDLTIDGISYVPRTDTLIAAETGKFGDDYEDRIIEVPRTGENEIIRAYGDETTDKWGKRIDAVYDSEWR